MKKIVTAIALSVALPAVAHAQNAPAPSGKMDCCEKMKAEKDCCCKGMGGSHDQHGQQQPSGKPKPDQHQNHQNH
ncbi:MAG: hypothetical protein ACJ8EY_10340 [Sphingomicrobium sp.]